MYITPSSIMVTGAFVMAIAAFILFMYLLFRKRPHRHYGEPVKLKSEKVSIILLLVILIGCTIAFIGLCSMPLPSSF